MTNLDKRITNEEDDLLFLIPGRESWTQIEKFEPEPLYVPEQGKLKTGVISIPPKPEKPLPPSLKKYTLMINGKKHLLRIRDISEYEEERALAVFSDRVFREGGAYVSSPVEVDAFNNETMVYSLYLYYGGSNLARRLTEFYMPQQLSLGVEAGKQLRKIHSVLPSDDDTLPQEEEILMLINRLEEKGTDYRGFKQACEFIRTHGTIVLARPVTAIHGAFSANKLFLDDGLNVGIMPFEQPAWGDPIRDLATLPDGYSLPFIKGVFKGLFDGDPPKDLFELLAYYSTLNALKDLDEAIGEQTLPMMIRAEKVAADFDNYQSAIPIWY